MKNSSFFVYGLALVASVGLMLWILNVGDKLPASGDLVVAPVPGPVESGNVLWNSPLAMLLLQIVVILLVVRIISCTHGAFRTATCHWRDIGRTDCWPFVAWIAVPRSISVVVSF